MAGTIDPKKFIPEIKQLEKEISNVIAMLEKLVDSTISLDKEQKKSQATQKQLIGTGQKLNTVTEELSATEKEIVKVDKKIEQGLAKIKVQRKDQYKELERLQSRQREQRKNIKDEVELEKAHANSIKRLTLENKKYRKERDLLDIDKDADRISELNSIIDANTEKIKENTDSLTQQRMGVGGYADALGEFFPRIKGATEGVKGFGAQLRKLLLNPVILIIAALVAGLAALYKAFTRTQGGADAFADVMATVRGIIDVIIGRIGKLAKVVVRVVMNDWVGAWKAAKEAISGVKDEINDTITETGRIQALKRGLEEMRIASTTTIAELNKVAEEQAAISDDATKSFQERRRAANEADKAARQAAAEQLKLDEANLEIISSQNDLKETQGMLTRELRQQEADAVAQVIESRKNMSLRIIESEKRIAELRQDNFEQELDFLLDVADVQKTVNEKRIADERETLSTRREILQETIDLINESFDQQIELFESENKINIERNKLLDLNNKEIFEYARGLGLSEIETNRLLEVIRERRMAISDLREAEIDLNEQIREKNINDIEKAAEREILITKQKLLRKEISEEQFAEDILQIHIDYLKEQLDLTILTADERLKIETELVDKQIELQKKLTKENKEQAKIRLDDINSLQSEIFEIGQQFREAERVEAENQFNAENERIEAQAAKELKAVGDNAQAQERINEWLTDQKEANQRELDRKLKQIQRQQAIADKVSALFNAGINTAVAITKVLANPVLVAAVATLGAAQIAAIAATPIPKFAKGLEDSPKDIIGTVGEAGREIIEMPGGQRYLAEKEMTMFLPKGSSVIPNIETERIIQGGIEPKKFDELIKATRQNKNGRVEDTGYLYKVERKNLRQRRLDKYYKGI